MTGIIYLCPRACADLSDTFPVEVHEADEDAWYGYREDIPNGAYRAFSKSRYTQAVYCGSAKSGELFSTPVENRPKIGKDRTSWPRELMHTELCAWRFGGECDCEKN